MGLDFSVILKNWDYFLWGRTMQGELGGLILTILMSLAAGFLAMILGLAMAMISWLGPKPVGKILRIFTDIVRGIPLIFVIFWIYFLVPALFKTEVPGALSVVLALAWFSSGAVMYTTLAGLEALPKGQTEAGRAGGLTNGQIFTSILLPQALRNLIPSFVALFASMIKDTSLAYIMNVPELTMVANQVNTRSQIFPAEIFLFIAAVYFILCLGLSLFAKFLAQYFKPGRKRKSVSNLKINKVVS